MSSIGFRGMPGAGSTRAPSFSGRANELLDFFTQFEDLANSCGLDSAEQCSAILVYLDSDTKELWKSFPEYDAADYKAFKARIVDEYPGAEKGTPQYTYGDLERIVRTHAKSDISTETELVAFSHQFRPVATWLVKNNKLSEHERNELFWQGLPKRIRPAIAHQLQLDDPSYRAPPNFEKVIKAGRNVLANNGVDRNNLMTPRLRSARDLSAPPSNVKATPSRPSNVEATHSCPSKGKATPPRPSNVEAMPSRPSKGKATPSRPSKVKATPSRPSKVKVKASPSRPDGDVVPTHQTSSTTGSASAVPRGCGMCGEAHFISKCIVVEDYIRARRIVRNDRFLIYPDGSRLHPHPSTGLLRTTIDEYYGSKLLL